MIKKKILIISGEFIPFTQSIGGVIRIISFLKSLKGHELKLITLKKKYYGYFGFKNYISNVKKEYIGEQKNKKNTLFKIILLILKFFFSNTLYIAGIDQNFFNQKLYFKAVKKNLLQFKPNFILISGPPFSLFRIVNQIRKVDDKVKIILDYRDGWSQRIKSSRFLFFKKIMNKVEKKILHKSDFTLCATEQIYKDISFLKKKNIFLIKNGFLERSKNIKKNSKKNNFKEISIGYFGLISDNSFGYRDVNVIYDSLSNIKKIKFSFYGNSIIKNKKLKEFKYFNFNKNISYFETQNKMKNFDYLLILHTEKSTAKEVVTGKFYEYLSSGVPIIMISNGETEAGNLIKKYKLGYSIDYSKISLNGFFMNLKKKYNFVKNSSNLKLFSRKEQNKKLVKIINHSK